MKVPRLLVPIIIALLPLAQCDDSLPGNSIDVSCPPGTVNENGACECEDEMQIYYNGNCISPSGWTCEIDTDCVPGSFCADNNTCVCLDGYSEQPNTGYCISPGDGPCVDQSNCPTGQFCVDGTCICKYRKVYNPNALCMDPAGSPVAVHGACQIPNGRRCDRKGKNLYSNYIDGSKCVSSYCSSETYRCYCPDTSELIGTSCECPGDSFIGASMTCMGYEYAVPDNNSFHCPADTIVNNDRRSCDCNLETYLNSGASKCKCPNYMTTNDNGECVCVGVSQALDPKTEDTCICLGASKDYSGYCYGYSRSNLVNNVYVCPDDMEPQDAGQSCVCKDQNMNIGYTWNSDRYSYYCYSNYG